MRLRKAVAKLLAYERVCRAATAGKGVLHAVPVCHALDDGRIYFGSSRDSAKVRHLKREPYVAVLVDLYSEDWDSLRGVMIQGMGEAHPGRAPVPQDPNPPL